ncbi:MAG: hypothetical protein FWC25_01235 [Dehalococcoidia bacterium]|nr:hypothetical protein [Dehalococcoidia bacterium]
MKKKFSLIAMAVMGIFFIVGLVLILSAASNGLKAGDHYLNGLRSYSVVSDARYELIVNGTIVSFQMTGLVISIVGGFGLLASGYALYKEL